MIDWNERIQTVDGEEARLLCSDREAPDGCTHVVLVKNITATSVAFETVVYVTPEGRRSNGAQEIVSASS